MASKADKEVLAREGNSRADPTDAESGYPSTYRAWYTVAILLIAYIFSFIDRQILSLLVAPVRRELRITDTQMSLLIGFSFALFYSFLGLPFGRLADRINRPRLIATGVFAWSLMTGGCGLVHSYWQLFLLRMGVGIGEASLSPAAYSMISDSFTPAKRSVAFSVYTMGIYVGSGCAFLFGALLLRAFTGRETLDLPIVGPSQPWRVLFLILGLMGIFCSLALLMLRDPSRKDARVFQNRSGKTSVDRIPLRSVIAFLNQNRTTFFCLSFGLAMWAVIAYGSSAWEITFLVRNHHLSASQAGTFYGGAMMVSGSFGVLAAGKIASWLTARGHRDAYVRVAIWAAAAWLVPGTLYPVVPNTTASISLIYLCTFFRGMPTFVILAAILELVPNAMRGQATALYILIATGVGLGIGPTAIALVTDHLFGYDDAVRYSLVIVPLLACLLAGMFFLKGLRSYTASLDYLQVWLKENL